ncbi:hypothetical protein Mro03_61730 [Microbispora rosea subsp. rosea]|nr:hypothetical protein Mro03_61730 [Microbispora rosea subsp. rosea]
MPEHRTGERFIGGLPGRGVEAFRARREVERHTLGEHQFTEDPAGQRQPREPGMKQRMPRHIVVQDKVQVIDKGRARKIAFSHGRR